MADIRLGGAARPTLPLVIVVAAATMAVAGLGTWATELGPWYAALRQPSWKPPDLWFGPAWTTIFALTAWAVVRQWTLASGRRERRRVLLATLVNAALNVGWSLLFFKLRRPDWAAYEVVLLWLSVLVMVVVAATIDRVAAALLLPYLAWVAFAAVLNFSVVALNPALTSG